ncbi:FIG070318: hypothetical protein [hydrothermal vent metagenome]|uniref:BioF2-like acetyltransferase domain-containing protein n=1 Tax=hydrothermal vent metagenome TaxID=652676 RepID=A0A3B0XXX9_9ZZZZ
MTQADIKISVLDNTAPALQHWNQYLTEHPSANFYQRAEWRGINETEFGHKTFFLTAQHGNEIAGLFPLVFINSRVFGRILCSMPFVNFGGPCTNDPQIEAALVEQACKIAREQQADYMELRGLHRVTPELATSEHKISMTLELDADPDTLWNAFKSKHRTNIRRVYKNGVAVTAGGIELLDDFYDIMSQSWRTLGTPIYRKRYFHSILEAFGDDIRIFVATQNGTPVATAFNGHFQSTVEGMWAGAIPAYRKLQINYVLYWEMIKDACERGFITYHLGRSTVETGGESFKKKWNAESTQLYWQYYLPDGGEIPQLNVQNAKYQLAIRAWKRMPLWATQLIGPILAKDIP